MRVVCGFFVRFSRCYKRLNGFCFSWNLCKERISVIAKTDSGRKLLFTDPQQTTRQRTVAAMLTSRKKQEERLHEINEDDKENQKTVQEQRTTHVQLSFTQKHQKLLAVSKKKGTGHYFPTLLESYNAPEYLGSNSNDSASRISISQLEKKNFSRVILDCNHNEIYSNNGESPTNNGQEYNYTQVKPLAHGTSRGDHFDDMSEHYLTSVWPADGITCIDTFHRSAPGLKPTKTAISRPEKSRTMHHRSSTESEPMLSTVSCTQNGSPSSCNLLPLVEVSPISLGDFSHIDHRPHEMQRHEEISTGNFVGAFHSTFNYPLHSTLNQPTSNCVNTSVVKTPSTSTNLLQNHLPNAAPRYSYSNSGGKTKDRYTPYNNQLAKLKMLMHLGQEERLPSVEIQVVDLDMKHDWKENRIIRENIASTRYRGTPLRRQNGRRELAATDGGHGTNPLLNQSPTEREHRVHTQDTRRKDMQQKSHVKTLFTSQRDDENAIKHQTLESHKENSTGHRLNSSEAGKHVEKLIGTKQKAGCFLNIFTRVPCIDSTKVTDTEYGQAALFQNVEKASLDKFASWVCIKPTNETNTNDSTKNTVHTHEILISYNAHKVSDLPESQTSVIPRIGKEQNYHTNLGCKPSAGHHVRRHHHRCSRHQKRSSKNTKWQEIQHLKKCVVKTRNDTLQNRPTKMIRKRYCPQENFTCSQNHITIKTLSYL